MIKEKYEISIWEDRMTPATYKLNNDEYIIEDKIYYYQGENGYIPIMGKKILEENLNYTLYDLVSLGHLEEEKIAVIGSNKMNSLNRALEPCLTSNINGTDKLVFKMYYTYVDTETGKKINNPFVNLIFNERKVKLYWQNKWYDFVVKGSQQDSNNKMYIYTCVNAYANELSKSGFDLVFDTKLKNSTDTLNNLASEVLKNSGWKVNIADTMEEFREEPVYFYQIKKNSSFIIQPINGDPSKEVSSGKFLIYYSSATLVNIEDRVQVLYFDNNTSIDYGELGLITNGLECFINSNTLPDCSTLGLFEDGTIKARKHFQSQKQFYEPVLNKFVNLYQDQNGKNFGGYSKTDTFTPDAIINFVINNKDFVKTEGWSKLDGSNLVLDFDYDEFNKTIKSYIRFTGSITNDGFQKSLLPEEGFTKGEKFIFRYKVKTSIEEPPITPEMKEFSIEKVEKTDDWFVYELKCNQSLSKKDLLLSKCKLILSSNLETSLKELEFFKKISNADGSFVSPNNFASGVYSRVRYYYYDIEANKDKIDKKDFIYSSILDEPSIDYKPIKNEKFEKIRTLSASKSNRFNLLQKLAEVFECWVTFQVEHDMSTGHLIYEGEYPKKTVIFHKEIGKHTGYGFVYGIDLKSINRTIDSNQIVTKVHVPNNNNTMGEHGFCSISRSKENYSGNNFIINLDYYCNKKLIDRGKLNLDLYSSLPNHLGYYFHSKEINDFLKDYEQKVNNLKASLTHLNAAYKVCIETISATEQEIIQLESDIVTLAGVDNFANAWTYIVANQDHEALKEKVTTREKLLNTLTVLEQQKKDLRDDSQTKPTGQIPKLEAELTNLIDEQTKKIKEKEKLDFAFNQKYQAYLQEGSWLSEEYYDDTKYYLDAENVAYTSSKPKVSYNINVLRLSSLEEFKGKIFNLGDISYIQDTEFFGYEKDKTTPRKEEVLISELVSYLDSPEKNSIKVQNYKNQFEDLFQHMTATTQKLEYAQGSYSKAADAISPEGTVDSTILQDSFDKMDNLVIQSQNEHITQDSTGITLTDELYPNLVVRISSRGIFCSQDGGEHFYNGITGDGIAVSSLKPGRIDTEQIYISGGPGKETFRWDREGISAYEPRYSQDEKPILLSTNQNKFVRFDNLGIYGISVEGDPSTIYTLNTLQEVKNTAKFGLTWDGLFIRNKYNENEYLEIGNESDIRLIQKRANKELELIKIGHLYENRYGLRLSALKTINGIETLVPTLETKNDGSLWLSGILKISQNVNNPDFSVSIGYLDNIKSGLKFYKISNYYPSQKNNIYSKIFYKDSFHFVQIFYHDSFYYYPVIYNKNDILREYYSLNEQGTFTKVENLIIDKIYYIKLQEQDLKEKELYESHENDIHEVLNANNNFIIYENGDIVAKNGEFTGVIHAKSGNIGNLTIEEIESLPEMKYEVIIDSSNGTILKEGETTLSAKLYYNNEEVIDPNLTYNWKKDGKDLNKKTQTIVVFSEDLGETEIAQYSCEILRHGV